MTRIRQAELSDEPVIRSMYLAFLQEVQLFGHDIVPDEESVKWAWDTILKGAVERKEPVLIAESMDGTVHGIVAWATSRQPTVATGHCIYVAPESRRKGIGQRLMDSARYRCRQLGILKVFDMISVGNRKSLSLFAKSGVEPVAMMYAFNP